MRALTKLLTLSLLLSKSVSTTPWNPQDSTSRFALDPLLQRDTTGAAQCGKDAGAGNETCPLNVCCSEYGNCGTTADFCGKGCQSNCGQVNRPACEAQTSAAAERTVGYYESWSSKRKCQSVKPEALNVTGFTHVNYGFLAFDPGSFAIVSADGNGTELLTRFTDLKSGNPGLQTWVAVGGWNFNEPGPTATTFSDMVGSQENRTKFIREIVPFMETYAFDGLDLDWEYPVASDRGGKPEDKENLVALTREIREAFGSRYGLSITLPASYFYMKNFDIAAMQQHVDFFNIMSYDLHGVWDKETKGVGPYIRPHTNLTEIDEALDLLWRAKVAPQKVNMGMAWYGRSFTLQQPNCTSPKGVCQFSGPGMPGPCSEAEGILDLAEIQDLITTDKLTPRFDNASAVKYMAYNSTQWVGFDDDETIGLKQAFASKRCLGGTMVWAMDQARQNAACGLPKAVRSAASNLTGGAFGYSNGTTACSGQTITASGKRAVSVPGGSLWSRGRTTACDDLSTKYGIATGTLQKKAGSSDCQVSGSLCAPAACSLTQIQSNTSSESIIAAARNVTLAQLKSWNPSVLGSWDSLTEGQYICTSPPGGWYMLASPQAPASSTSSTTATASAVQASIPAGASSASMVPTDAPTATDTSNPAASGKTQSGIASNCNSYATATSGDTCISFAGAHNIEPSQLYAWNPVLGVGGSACSTALWAEESYCVGTGSGGAPATFPSEVFSAISSTAMLSSDGVPSQAVPTSTPQGAGGEDADSPSSATYTGIETASSSSATQQSSDAVTSGVPYSVSNTDVPATALPADTLSSSDSAATVPLSNVTSTVNTCTIGASASNSTYHKPPVRRERLT